MLRVKSIVVVVVNLGVAETQIQITLVLQPPLGLVSGPIGNVSVFRPRLIDPNQDPILLRPVSGPKANASCTTPN